MREERRMNVKRRQKRRKDRSLSIKASLILCLLVIFFAGVNSMSVMAGTAGGAADKKAELTKVYSSYNVSAGDNMYSIAKKYCNLDYYDDYEEYIREIEDINHITDGKIYAGRCITIPKYV